MLVYFGVCVGATEWKWKDAGLNGGLWIGLGFGEVSWLGLTGGRPLQEERVFILNPLGNIVP